jgi:2-C-methyl-D-erythritol 4-phosphate cytidylyltransferase
LPGSATHVLIHDAARPLVPKTVVASVVAALADGAKAVVPVTPVTDTLRQVDGGTVDRSAFVAVQTPQGFELTTLAEAHAGGADATDDAAIIEQNGVAVVHVDGSTSNLKITFPHDLAVAEALLAAAEDSQEAKQ